MDQIVKVKLDYSSDVLYCRKSGEEEISKGDALIAKIPLGVDLVHFQKYVTKEEVPEKETITEVLRIATEEDIKGSEDNKKLSDKAFHFCREQIEYFGLDMRLIKVHYLLKEPKILFFFVAEKRVDFRSLIKILATEFKARIELRQINQREVASFFGGISTCGRPFCCTVCGGHQTRQVSIRMATDQGLSLNSGKQSGQCGRLQCCLAFEHDFYVEEKKNLPSLGYRFRAKGESFQVTDVNVFKKTVKVISSRDERFDLPEDAFKREGRQWQIKNSYLNTLLEGD